MRAEHIVWRGFGPMKPTTGTLVLAGGPALAVPGHVCVAYFDGTEFRDRSADGAVLADVTHFADLPAGPWSAS